MAVMKAYFKRLLTQCGCNIIGVLFFVVAIVYDASKIKHKRLQTQKQPSPLVKTPPVPGTASSMNAKLATKQEK